MRIQIINNMLTIIVSITLVIMMFPLSIQATDKQMIDFESQGFQEMSTTAYCVGHTTANGSPVHHGGCANSIDRIGDVAIVYTLDGHFLGYYECNDTGAGGVRAGTVLDIYRCNYTQCMSYMKITKGKVYVKWIEGKG